MLRKVALPVTTTSALSERLRTFSEVTEPPSRHLDQAAKHTEIEQSKCEFTRPGGHALEAILTFGIAARRQFGFVDYEVDRDARKNGARLIEHAARDAALRVHSSARRDQQRDGRNGCAQSDGRDPHLDLTLRANRPFGLVVTA